MPKKIREILQILAEDGWRVVRQRGSHRQLKHPIKPGLVTIAGHPGDDLHSKTEESIFRGRAKRTCAVQVILLRPLMPDRHTNGQVILSQRLKQAGLKKVE